MSTAKNYTIAVTHDTSMCRDYEVEASSQEEAERIAIEKARYDTWEPDCAAVDSCATIIEGGDSVQSF